MSVTDCEGFNGSLENTSDKLVDGEGRGVDTRVPSPDWLLYYVQFKGAH